MIGKTLLHYEITDKIGEGGMGKVYQAKDQKLGRNVAIKVLPEEFAKDIDRIARFKREAKLLASLNHPNIAAIYGLEESDGTHFLVLELIEGDTLADRIKSGPIPGEEALKLALEIAEALEAAHEKGVIHRDLKPANIKVTPDGRVKVLDFGLAKAFAGEQANLNLSNSPTLSNAVTLQGVILGTAAYMSPEQARGMAVDKKADIWAFGCVLFEMLTGQQTFHGEDITEILAAVVRAEANLDLLPENLHPRVREVLTRCLQKDLKKRYSSIAEARYEIEQTLTDPSGVFVQPAEIIEPRNKLRFMLPWLAAAIVLTAIIVGVAVWKYKPTEPKQTVRFEYELPEGQQFTRLEQPILAISPDGSRFVYRASQGLYLRSMGELDAGLVSGADESPMDPFFSPDGLWVGYWSQSNNQLKKVEISGGAPVTICDASDPMHPTWNIDGTIVYAQDKGIMKISANGGTPELIVASEGKLIWAPQILPDEKSVLFSLFDDGEERIAVQSLQSGERKILKQGTLALYLPTGHLVYGLRHNLLAIHFDLDSLEVVGGPIPMVEGIMWAGETFATQYAVSDSGTLVFMRQTKTIHSTVSQRTLVWVDRNGKEEPLAAQPNAYGSPRISPDGTKVAMTISSNAKKDIWVWDIIRETITRLTFNEASNFPLWSLDGQRIAFFSGSSLANAALCLRAADGTGEDEKLGMEPDKHFYPAAWSKDGKTLVTFGIYANTGFDIGSFSMEGDHKWRPLLQEKYIEGQPEISPDGRWMAYSSNESGQPEVYVRSFPDVNKVRSHISTDGGSSPLWSPDGRELFYRNGDEVMVVSVETEPTFKAGKPETLFSGTYALGTQVWDISPDGKRFLMMKEVASDGEPAATETTPKINIVTNWFEELKQKVPVK